MQDQIGRYRILSEVARGGMGVVFRAEDPQGRLVAIKLLLAGPAASEGQWRRFQREVQTLLELRHPNLVQLLDAGVERGHPWLALEWVEGSTLAGELAHAGVFEQRDAAELVAKLARALGYCHTRGVIHRDLKPENVLLRALDGEPLLTDFGLAGDADSQEDQRSRLTRSGAFLGTPGYWSPEQARGDLRRLGPASDVWGLGALLFALLTGEPPVRGASLPEVLAALDRPPPPSSALRPGVAPALDEVCRRCLALDPAARYPDADALAEALERWCEAGAPRAGRAGLIAAAAAGTLLVASLAAAAVVAFRRGEAPTPLESPSAATASPPPQATGAPASAAEPPELADLRARGEACIDEQNAEGAVQAFQRLLELRPDDARGHVGLAAGYALRNELEAALAELERAMALDPREPRAWVGRGAVRARRRDFAGARADLERALELDPQRHQAWTNLSGVCLETNDLAGARAALDRALELAPGDTDVLASRAALRARAGDLVGAEADLDRVVEQRPGAGDGWSARAAVRAERDDLRGALADLDRALELEPRLAGAWLNRGAVRGRMGDADGALEDYERAVALDPREPLARFNRGHQRERRGDLVGALSDYELFLELAPEHDGADQVRARVAALRDRRETFR